MVAPRTGCGCSCCSDEQQENFQKHNLCCSPTLKCGPYCELVPSIWQLFLAVFSNDFFKILSNMSRYQSLGIQQGIWGTLLLIIGKWPFLFCRFKPLCNFSGPQTVHKSLLGSKSEELVESFKFIQFVVGTGIDKVLYKMLMYSHTISSRVRKDTWLKGRRRKK